MTLLRLGPTSPAVHLITAFKSPLEQSSTKTFLFIYPAFHLSAHGNAKPSPKLSGAKQHKALWLSISHLAGHNELFGFPSLSSRQRQKVSCNLFLMAGQPKILFRFISHQWLVQNSLRRSPKRSPTFHLSARSPKLDLSAIRIPRGLRLSISQQGLQIFYLSTRSLDFHLSAHSSTKSSSGIYFSWLASPKSSSDLSLKVANPKSSPEISQKVSGFLSLRKPDTTSSPDFPRSTSEFLPG
ncbi:hypothetical protein Nepgr_030792 [Nepenthes gracilis]|uniref:Uncharacterized protein n=1 Tax=Nepenthes gracilis TaxID=150966 RepID=A0AAD3Y6E6_NEPGR|nr:hypothetical protein Nepgr_030792 [Nepenthes gracilis]